MSQQIVTCQCGVKLRVPAEGAERGMRCPKCKATIELPSPEAVLSTQGIDVWDSASCPICQTSLRAGGETITCPSCQLEHHLDCWTEIGGCGTYGCPEAPSAAEDEKSAQPALSAWGDTKKCPACGETIKAIALRCRYCQTDFDTVDPLSVADLRVQARTQERADSSKKSVVAVFVLSIFGLLAPLMLVVSLVYAIRKRDQLSRCGPVFVIMSWASVVLSALYSLLLLLFFLLGH